jgi:hypothetical protein
MVFFRIGRQFNWDSIHTKCMCQRNSFLRNRKKKPTFFKAGLLKSSEYRSLVQLNQFHVLDKVTL